MATAIRPPGPPNRGIVGNFPLASKDPLALYTQWARQYGDIVYYRNFRRHVFLLNHPDLIKDVLLTDYRDFIKDQVLQFSRPIFGNGLLTNEGEPWLRQRRLIQPAFHRDRINAYATTMTAHTQHMLSGWKDGDRLDIHAAMMKLALGIVSKTLFDLEDGATTAKISSALNTILHLTTGARLLMPPFIRRLPTPDNLRYRRAVRQLDEIVFGLIRQRRQTGEHAGDLLSVLQEVRDEDGEPMSDRQLRDEVLTLLLAGHETTATSLSWTWTLLARHPEVERRLWAELEGALAGTAPGPQHLPRLPFTERVVKEAMRLYPPAWATVRASGKDLEIGGYQVPRNSTVLMCQWITHRDPRFFDDPDRFDPDRWLETRSRNLPKFAYFPFGGGPRSCIGASFAMMEAILILATVAQKFQITLASDTPPANPVPTITLRPDRPMEVILKKRTPTPAPPG